jgi:site-specific recombinase XerD
VALPHQALKIIVEYLASNSPVSRASDPLIRKQDGSGDALSYYVINRVITRWTKRHLGVRLTPHKLRHAYGRQCVDLGVDIRIIAEALGHESLESTKIYYPGLLPAHPPNRRTIWLLREAQIIRCKTLGEIRYFTRAGTSRSS